jgi:hypothetical protein
MLFLGDGDAWRARSSVIATPTGAAVLAARERRAISARDGRVTPGLRPRGYEFMLSVASLTSLPDDEGKSRDLDECSAASVSASLSSATAVLGL